MNKYGIQQKITAENGDIYEWTGNNYMRTYVAERMGVEDIAKAAIIATAAGGLATGFAPMVSGALGVAPSGMASGAIKGALGATAGGALNGNIDPKTIAVGALMGGLNPGGMLSNKFGMNPKSFGSGFVSGATNDLVGNTLMTGDVDLKGSVVAGLQAGGVNSLMDAVNSINNNTPEAIMDRIADQHRADYVAIHGNALGYEGLTDVQLNQIAMSQPLVNKTTLGSLIGDGGLIPAIPAMDISGLATIKDNIFGYAPGTELFTGPNGEELTNAELIQQGYDPQDVYGATMQGVDVDGYKYVLPTNQQDGLLTQITDYLGDTKIGETVGTALDVAANAQFKDKYGFLPQDNPQLAQQIVAYGDLVENYTYADNPRGDSEMYGSTFWKPDEYTKGYTTLHTPTQLNQDGTGWVGGTRSAINVSQETIDQINELGEAQREEILNSPFIINYQQQQQQTQVDAVTGSADENTVLPGAKNNPFMDQLIAALQGGNTEDKAEQTEDEVASEVTDQVTDQVKDEVTDNPPANTDVQVGNSDYRNQQITGMLSQTIDSLPENTNQIIPETDQVIPNNEVVPELTEEMLAAAAVLLAGGGGGDDGGGMLELASDNRDKPYWTPLNAYSKPSKWQRSRERVYDNVEGLLTASGKAPQYAMSKRQMTEEGLLS
jgi:hypothetical protein